MADSLFACLYVPAHDAGDAVAGALPAIAVEFSPRYEHRHTAAAERVVIDVSGLERLIGPPRAIGEELRRMTSARGVRAHVAIAATQTAACVLAHAQPGLSIAARGAEADALAPLPIARLDAAAPLDEAAQPVLPLDVFRSWGLKTLGDLAALPAADLVARFGRQALEWQAAARGEDVRPLVPTLEAERFEATLELEWPIEGLEPLSFVLTRLLEPLSTRLERRDRGAAVLHVLLRLVTRETVARRLELPAPMREVRALRTLALLDLEAHPPGTGIDRVTIVIDPTPGRVVQHRLFARPHPTPEQLSTLLARLGAVMGQDRVGAPAAVDTYRPGAFALTPLPVESRGTDGSRGSRGTDEGPLLSALRRCRHPVPARVTIAAGRPARVTTDRRGFAGGAVVRCAGPWRTSGDWWQVPASPASPWDRDEWDVALADGAVYRIFRDRARDQWFIDAVVD